MRRTRLLHLTVILIVLLVIGVVVISAAIRSGTVL